MPGSWTWDGVKLIGQEPFLRDTSRTAEVICHVLFSHRKVPVASRPCYRPCAATDHVLV